MENKFILITSGDSPAEKKTLHVQDKPYVIHDRNLLVINFNHVPKKGEHKGLIEVFYNLLDTKQNHYSHKKTVDLAIDDFFLEKTDHIYILHHHYSDESRVQLNTNIISFLKERGFYNFFVSPYSKGASDSFALSRVSIFGREDEIESFDIIKESIKNASSDKSKIFNFYEKEKLLYDEKITLISKIKRDSILFLDVLFVVNK